MIRIIIVTIAMWVLGYCALAQSTQGFFLNDHKPKKAGIPKSYISYQIPSSASTVKVEADFSQLVSIVSPYLYGNNANPYMTDIISQPKLLDGIKMLAPQILRYPGGNISNTFFWNATTGQKPADAPDTILYGDKRRPTRENYFYGKNESANTLSLNKYYNVLKLTNSTGIICVNYGYARYGTGANPVQTAAHLAADWVRYDKGRTRFWEVGNEDYGTWQAGYIIDSTKNKDGQPRYVTGKLYGEHFKIFADSMKAAAKQIGAEIYIGAVIIESPKVKSWEGAIEKGWNSGFFKSAGNTADFFDIHSYFTPFEQNSSAEVILNTAVTETTKMMQYMHSLAIENHVSLKPVALTEWNIFSTGSKQMCSYINGMHAAIVLGELAKNKYGMASRWDLANGYDHGNDHGMFSRGDEPGVPMWNPRPPYYYMYLFNKYFGDQFVNTTLSGDTDVLAYASKFSSGEAGIVLVNKGQTRQNISLSLQNYKPGNRYYFYTLTGGNDNGEFSQRVFVNGVTTKYTAGGPDAIESIKPLSGMVASGLKFDAPARSVIYVLVEKQ